MFQEVGGLYGVSERGGGGFEFRALTAWGKNLLSSGGTGSDAPEPSS